MNLKLLPWVVVIVCVAMGCMTLLMVLRIDPTPFVALLGVLVLPVVGAVIYGKVEQVQQQTNGTQQTLVSMVQGVLEHLKTHNTVPIPQAPTKVTSTVESTTGGGVERTSTVDISGSVDSGGQQQPN